MLAAYDDQLRRGAPAEPGAEVERDGPVVRLLAPSWAGVVWSDLSAADADRAIAAQVARFAELGRSWEWKLYSHDRPADLPRRLLAAGLRAGTTEALMAAEVAVLGLAVPPPAGVRLVPVVDESGVDALVRVHDEVFGGSHGPVGRAVLAALAHRPAPIEAVVAMAGDRPVSAARVEFPAGTDFAGLYGGGTLPGWRGRGIFRALVAHRAALARDRGIRYLQVDASPDSRPILGRLGFVELATTTPYVLSGPPDAAAPASR